jgi:hypothetical protein
MKKYILIIAAFFTAGISGCKKDYLSLEVNPNAPSVTTPQLTLSAALSGAANIIVNDYPAYGVWAGYWTTSGNYVPNTTVNEFQLTNSSLIASWNDWYTNLTNLNNLQKLAAADPSLANYQAIAMIMKAYGFQHLVDDYNDVPYTQAFQPATILFPVYDKGVDIYHDLGKQLDAAIALINKSSAAAAPGPDDIVFKGNMTSWKKFANSLKLRLAIRVSSKTSGDALVTDLASTASEGYLDGILEARANPGYSNTAGKQNPFYANFGLDPTGNEASNSVYYRANNFAISTLTSFNDPRLATEYSLTVPAGAPAGTAPSVYHGNVFGDTKTTNLTNANNSGVGPGLSQSPTQDAILFSGAESLFLQAEALNDGFAISGNPATPATAQLAYDGGITASFLDQGLTSAQATTYMSQAIANVGWTASTDKEQAIITQKWIALNGYFNFEAWNEYRRTGFPVHPFSIDPAAASSTAYPSRILYPLSELTTNPTNLGKEGTIDIFTSKIFWAK